MKRIWWRIKKILRSKGWRALLRDSLGYLLRFISAPACWWHLRTWRAQELPLPGAVDFALRNPFHGCIGTAQRPLEIRRLMQAVSDLHPNTVVEIGTAAGGTLFLLARVAGPNATIVSIDLREGGFGGGYPAWKIPLYRAFAKQQQKIHLMRGDSHASETLASLQETINNRPIDVLFIDGDHSYDGVKRDFEMYSPLVRKGGIIAFHDIVPGSARNVGGVPQFWQEIKQKYGGEEFVEDWKQGGLGIGMIRTP